MNKGYIGKREETSGRGRGLMGGASFPLVGLGGAHVPSFLPNLKFKKNYICILTLIS